ncbi:tyrosine-type recombinase/integrase [Thiorhodovibrio frisius]|uniref:Site-specific recombinase XerD n=1 Tax=Thiorhodovibrio frisius TaxID=631362 RepID=H8Z721_9GAMM|nr:site-specific integrase [Thiorhodovibrio frisius]EIC20820.1 site-specific recombinase XerD [Thiorhodovibrio frisius]WPL21872.1 Integrase [Thiorhodovibrio frisius]
MPSATDKRIREALTDKRIREYQTPEKGKRIYWDAHRDAPKGFGLRVTSAGTKAFVLRYRARSGQERILTIGEFGAAWSLTAARIEAARLRALVDQGKDPLGEKHAARDEMTIAALVDRFCKSREGRLHTANEARGYLERDLIPVMGKRRIDTVKRSDIISLVEARALKAPRAAALLLTYIKQLFSFAEDRELLPLSPATGIKPAKIDKALKPRKRRRVLDDDEIRALWNGEAGTRGLTLIALKLILLTGQRPVEVLGMSWSEIDGETWIIPAARRRKTDTEHRVYLTKTALALLEQAKEESARLATRRKWKPSDFVFVHRDGGKPATVAGLDRAVARAVAPMANKSNADWGHWTPHDLRRTCRTRLAALGVSEEVAERTIGHGKTGVVAVYNQHDYSAENRAAWEKWERALLGIVGNTVSNVVPFAKSAVG